MITGLNADHHSPPPSRRLFTVILVLSAGCRNHEAGQPLDHPRLTPNLTLQDVTFRSSALNRDIQYRVVWR